MLRRFIRETFGNIVYERMFLRLFKATYRLLYFTSHVWLFRDLHLTDYVAPTARLVNFMNISLGGRCIIGPGATLGGELNIGRNVYINEGCFVAGRVEIGDEVMLAPRSAVIGVNHGYRRNGVPMVFQTNKSLGIRIGRDVWLGYGAVILDGVTVGEGAVIGAQAVVTEDVQPFSVVVGNPARHVRFRE